MSEIPKHCPFPELCSQIAGSKFLDLPREEQLAFLARLKQGCRTKRAEALACSEFNDSRCFVDWGNPDVRSCVNIIYPSLEPLGDIVENSGEIYERKNKLLSQYRSESG